MMSPVTKIGVAVSLLLCLPAYSQPSRKVWDSSVPLQWSDYHGKANPRYRFAAYTYYGTNYGYYQHQSNGQYRFTFEVSCYVDRNKSWVKHGQQSAALLRHEQLHFDIAEFFAQQLLTALNNNAYTSNFKAEITEVEHLITGMRKMVEVQYDRQTEHSVNTTLQKRWDAYVADLMRHHDYTLTQALAKLPR